MSRDAIQTSLVRIGQTGPHVACHRYILFLVVRGSLECCYAEVADASEDENLGGWLTPVVARVCLDMLGSRESRREAPLEAHGARADRERRGGHRPGA
jgi:hypothetical protein